MSVPNSICPQCQGGIGTPPYDGIYTCPHCGLQLQLRGYLAPAQAAPSPIPPHSQTQDPSHRAGEDDDQHLPLTPPKSAALSGFLSLVWPGAGQLFYGDTVKGILLSLVLPGILIGLALLYFAGGGMRMYDRKREPPILPMITFNGERRPAVEVRNAPEFPQLPLQIREQITSQIEQYELSKKRFDSHDNSATINSAVFAFVTLFSIPIGVWLWSIRDAYRGAKLHNRELRRAAKRSRTAH